MDITTGMILKFSWVHLIDTSLFRMCAVTSMQVVNIEVFDQYVSITTHIVNSSIFMYFNQECVNIIVAIKFKLLYL